MYIKWLADSTFRSGECHVTGWWVLPSSPTSAREGSRLTLRFLVGLIRTNFGDRAFSAAGPRLESGAFCRQTSDLSYSRWRRSYLGSGITAQGASHPLVLRFINTVTYFCAQPATELEGATSSTRPSLIEQFRYRSDFAVDGQVAELSLYKDPTALSKIGFPLTNFNNSQNPSQFVFATGGDDRVISVAMDAIGRIQSLFPNRSVYFYDLSDGVLDFKADKVRY